ncbi:MAG: hypothetical protein JWN04_6291 [Myxococcaceae bacterium]|nr:hypothetical protein [Myxococcaceae bacterium]
MTNTGTLGSSTRTFLDALTRELFQTETSASQHCTREAKRLGSTAPALALRAVAEHAEAVLRELPALAERNNLPVSKGGNLAGHMFSELRDKLFDRLIDCERSYRGTLLGCRHGLDVVRTLGHLAASVGNLELDAFCTRWLNTRTVLVERVEDELAWFAQHPDQATRLARPLVPSLRERSHASS